MYLLLFFEVCMCVMYLLLFFEICMCVMYLLLFFPIIDMHTATIKYPERYLNTDKVKSKNDQLHGNSKDHDKRRINIKNFQLHGNLKDHSLKKDKL